MNRADHLTPSQLEAVEHQDGPLLVLAGPGSGKTRVITRRIARLVEKGTDPRAILAITFTNKAAGEMRTRVGALLPGARVWISTFHKFCARLLRGRAGALGLQPNFSIYDKADQQQLLRQIVRELDLDAVTFPPAKIGSRISREKNALMIGETFARRFDESVGNHFEAVVARVWPEYQRRLLEANAVDFDDLLVHVATLLAENPELRRELDERFRYVLVDEYQDTNLAQYRIVVALSQDYPHLCVTGDPDQSIYGWRGARLENILRFHHDFPAAKVVRLEENFRSTRRILRAAEGLIVHNRRRMSKSLVTGNDEGEAVELLMVRDAVAEAERLAAEIRRQVEDDGRRWSDFAVFYRVNALSRQIEEALRRRRIPFQVAAGTAFYERAEVKDLLAYLRLIHNPDDEAAFRRVVNTPRRGIGGKSLEKLARFAAGEGAGLLAAAVRAAEVAGLSRQAARELAGFTRLIDGLAAESRGSVASLLKSVLDRTGYAADWQMSESEQDRQRLANVDELLNAAAEYDQNAGEEATLEGFLEAASLVSDVDTVDEAAGCVTLMTLHAAKGLEFPVVFIIGVEQGLIPHERRSRTGEPDELEEERRLLFVGMTRARQKLYLTQTERRAVRGDSRKSVPSPFLLEMLRTLRVHGDEGFQVANLFDGPSSHEPGSETDRQQLAASERETRLAAARRRRDRAVSLPKLTTAAEMFNGTHRAAAPPGFEVGMQVRHPRYGLGTIVECETGFSSLQTVTVEFSKSERTETFVTSHCPLQPVGAG